MEARLGLAVARLDARLIVILLQPRRAPAAASKLELLDPLVGGGEVVAGVVLARIGDAGDPGGLRGADPVEVVLDRDAVRRRPRRAVRARTRRRRRRASARRPRTCRRRGRTRRGRSPAAPRRRAPRRSPAEVVVTSATLSRSRGRRRRSGPRRRAVTGRAGERLLEELGLGRVDRGGVDVLAAGLGELGDAALAAALLEQLLVVVLGPIPVQTVGLEGVVERLPLQLRRLRDGADRTEQDCGHEIASKVVVVPGRRVCTRLSRKYEQQILDFIFSPARR